MKYDFNTVIDRKGSGDLMHEALLPRWGRDDLQPLWVADMDFAVMPDILDALRKRLEHPILGYTVEPTDYRPAIIDWIKTHHDWDVKPEWISFIPGIVKGIGLISNLFCKPDEKIIVMPPVYHPFFLVPRANEREVVWNPLKVHPEALEADHVEASDYYEMDFVFYSDSLGYDVSRPSGRKLAW